ncbi:hypothetical protein [Amycolatopsis taiwanensis]|uniref:Uncharacterized protein n=1 Tax=Amycolatopsis taiwanensis TaxID=342230 RepID=A0A9W6R6P6_9PSEU|nr:hypothetical protein [Amycolatopsis taiwanensis]GLY68455.1 hypothetical protein Atai01_50740 [Amycolatopsis taiwanensis]
MVQGFDLTGDSVSGLVVADGTDDGTTLAVAHSVSPEPFLAGADVVGTGAAGADVVGTGAAGEDVVGTGVAGADVTDSAGTGGAGAAAPAAGVVNNRLAPSASNPAPATTNLARIAQPPQMVSFALNTPEEAVRLPAPS